MTMVLEILSSIPLMANSSNPLKEIQRKLDVSLNHGETEIEIGQGALKFQVLST